MTGSRARPETETFGCALLAGIVVGIAFGLAAGLIIGYGYAASRPGPQTPPLLGGPTQSYSAAPTSGGRTGAPTDLASGRHAAPSHGSTPGPTQRAASRPAPVTVTPSPERTLVTAVTSGPGKWYDDGPGLYGAMRWFFWGMAPVPARVCGDRGCVRVTIHDHMVSTTTLIDLGPDAFRVVCGPLSRGVCTVTVER